MGRIRRRVRRHIRRRARKRIVRGLRIIAIISVVCVLGYFLHTLQVRYHARILLQRAKQARAEERLDLAVRNYGRYMELMPEDLDALAEYAELLVDVKSYGSAYAQLEYVLRRAPERSDLRKRLVDVLIRMGRYRDAQEHLERYLLRDHPNDPDMLYNLARCQRGLGQFEEAADTFRQVIEEKPDYVAAYDQLAALCRDDLKQPARGDEWMEKLVKAAPDSIEAQQMAADYYFKACNYELALEWSQRAFEKTSKNKQGKHADGRDIKMLLIAAHSAHQLKQGDLARSLAEQVVSLVPDRADAYSLLVTIQLAQGNTSQAIKVLQSGIDKVKDKDKGPLLWSLANLWLDCDDVPRAEQVIQELEMVAYPRERIDLLRAWVLVKKEQWFAAAEKLKQLRPDLIELPELICQADLLLGMCYARTGNLDEALSAYSRAIAQNPLWPQARLARATALAEVGQLDEAVNEYRCVLQLGKAAPQTVLEFTRLLVLSNLGRPHDQRNWNEVERHLQTLEQDEKTKSEAIVLHAEMLYAQGRESEAERLLEQSQSHDPNAAAIALALVSMKQRLGKQQEAETILNSVAARFGETVEILLLRARLAMLSPDGTAVREQLIQVAEKGNHLSGEQRQRLLITLASYAIQLRDFESARRWTQELAQVASNDLRVRLLFFDLAMESQDVAGLKPILEEIVQTEGRSSLWQYGEAVRLFLEAQGENRTLLRQALDRLTRASIARPNWARIAALQGNIYALLDDAPAAANAYLRAFRLGDRSVSTARRLVQLLYSQQRFIEADRVCRLLESQQTPFSIDLDRLASNVSLRLENYERAIRLARQAAMNSKEFRDHLWYATVQSVMGLRYRDEGRQREAEILVAEAENEFRVAVDLAPESVEVWVALIHFYARIGDKEKIRQTIAEVQQRSKDRITPLAMGQVFEILGAWDEAEKYYQQALDALPNDPHVLRQAAEAYLRAGQSSSAEAQLERLISGQTQAAEDDVAWARRNLALILGMRGGYENLQKGLELIRQNRQAEPAPSIEDIRAEALLLSVHPLRKKRKEGRNLLEKAIAESPQPRPEDHFLAVRLYMADGDLVNAARHMRTLLSSQSDDPRYITRYVSFLLDHNQLVAADAWLSRLEQLVPDAFSTISAQARLLMMQGRHDEAVRLFQAFAQEYVQRYVSFLLDQSQTAEADVWLSYLEKLAPQAFATVSARARLLTIQGHYSEAVHLLREFAQKEETQVDITFRSTETSGDGIVPNQTAPQELSCVGQLPWALAAQALESLGCWVKQTRGSEKAELYFSVAEKLYRQFTVRNPEGILLLAGFMARHGKLSEGLDLFEQHWRQSEITLIQAAARVFSEQTHNRPREANRVEKILREALEQFQRPISLLHLLASFYGMQGRIAESEILYREILERDPKNTIALNNLATVLAMKREKLDEAEQLIGRAIAIAGPASTLLDSQAVVLLARGKPQQALEVLKEAIEDQPMPLFLFHQAQAYRLVGQSEAAAKSFEEALKRGLTATSVHPLERDVFQSLHTMTANHTGNSHSP